MTRADIAVRIGSPRVSTVCRDGQYVEVRTGLDSIDPSGAIVECQDTADGDEWIAALSDCLGAYHQWDCAVAEGRVSDDDAAEVCWLDLDLDESSLRVSAESVREALAVTR